MKTSKTIKIKEIPKILHQLNEVAIINQNWKTINIPDLKGYEVNEYGQVRSKKQPKLIRKGTIDNNGYRSVNLRGISGRKKYLVHRLVCLTFKPDEYVEGYVVDHIDENKLNNYYKNLQFITRGSNVRKSFKKYKGVVGSKRRNFTDGQVRSYRDMYNSGISIWEIWDKILDKKASYPTVSLMLRRKTYKDVK